MATELDLHALWQRLDAAESEIGDLRRAVTAVEDAAVDPKRLPLWRRLARSGGLKTWTRTDLDEMWTDLGVGVDQPSIGARRIQEMMVAEGVRPEECIASHEITSDDRLFAAAEAEKLPVFDPQRQTQPQLDALLA